MKKKKLKLFNSCDTLPLWNFFKVNEGEQLRLKYVVALQDRLDYKELEVSAEVLGKCEDNWFRIFEEYNALKKNYTALNFINEKSKILLYTARYQQEFAIIMRLVYKTSANYIAFLRKRGYKISNLSQQAYADSLVAAKKRVENHQTQIAILVNQLKAQNEDNKQVENPYEQIMAWILSNDIKVDDNITVARYIKIEEIIKEKIKRNGRAGHNKR